jgi:tetratricopeptide (TPR) repeat protein
MLVLLDNARDADQVIPLLPAEPGCAVLVTSRDHLAGLVVANGAHPVPLGLLPPDEARCVLAARLGEDRLAVAPTAVTDIVNACAGLPLALAIVAARAAIHPTHPLDALAAELRDILGALDHAVDVRAIFSWSYRTLSDTAARLFRLVAGLHPGPQSTVAAASLSGMPVPRVRPLLAELTRANLLMETAPGTYSCHDLLRAYAAELCAAHDPDRDTARHRLVDHYVHTAYAAAGHLHAHLDTVGAGTPDAGVAVTRFTGLGEALAWFEADRAALISVLAFATDVQVCRLARTLFDVLHRQGRWHERVDTQRLAVAAAARLGDPAAESLAHRTLAVALADVGCFDDAHRHLDIALQRSGDDPVGQAWTHYRRDIVYAIEGRGADALAAAREAHDLFEQCGDDAGRAIALTDVGWHHGRLGNHGPALDLLEQALVLHQKLGNRGFEAHTLSCLAETHVHLGDHATAVTRYRRSLHLFRALGDRYAEASILAHIGACHHVTGNHPAAREQWRDAHILLGQLDPSLIDQIYTQLVLLDRRAADAFTVCTDQVARHQDSVRGSAAL